MFESAELGHKIDREQYKKEAPPLREDLLSAQYELLDSKRFQVVVVIAGVEGAGKGETVNLLHAWMDPRHIASHAFGEGTDEERARPRFYRYFRALPPKGTMGIFFGSWYTAPIVARATGESDDADLDQSMEEIIRFERMLSNEGALLLKFWFHLSKKEQKKRLVALEKDDLTSWRVTPNDWSAFKRYDKYRSASERALRETSREEAPWIVVEGADERYRNLTVAKAIRDAIRGRLVETAKEAHHSTDHSAPLVEPVDGVSLLSKLDLGKKLDKKEYEARREEAEARLGKLARSNRFKDIALACVFEGMDAAGKGGAIRRVTSALDARQYRVVPIAAPTEEERAQPYLWRFWRHVPARGRVVIFDRSWYGRVLVERIEGFCTREAFMRAYGEINDFEEQLVRHDIVLAKFWLQIDKDEQLARFKEREQVGFKRYKITSEDWRNREKWDAYETAACDMFDRTSTEIAPWTLVEANDKRYARVKVMETIARAIEEKIG